MFNTQVDVPMYIGDQKVFTEDKRPLSPPHDHKHIVGTSNYGSSKHVKDAIDSAMNARK